MMNLLILVGLLSAGYCSENDGKEEYKIEERRIAGGGNYGGFIGLTTYGAGPFLVKGKYERDNYGGFGPYWQGSRQGFGLRDTHYDDKSQRDEGRPKDYHKEDSKKDDKNDELDVKNIGNVGHEETQHDHPHFDGQERDGNKKNDDYLEYLGYRGGDGYCTGEYGYKDRYGNRDRYGRHRARNREGLVQNRNNSDYYDEARKERCDNLFGFTGPTANDEPENLMRPCALDDWQCIRKYFAANGKCKPAYGPIPDPLYIDVNTVFYPLVNLTVALPNLQIRGLSSAKIRDFYVNKKSGNLVFAFDVTNLNETIPRAYFRYRRTAKESIVLADFATVLYRSITFTAVIPKVPTLRLDLADIHPDIQDPTPPYYIGPGAIDSRDPDVIAAFADFNLFYPIITRESMLFKSQLLTAIYIQENICDFGLKLISV